MRIGVKTGPWGWSFAELERSWEAAEEVGFNILACFDHVTAGPKEAASWDAPALLAAMAARTSRITLAARVLNVCLRHVFLLAGQLAVVQALSGGRLDVGLGAGSFGLARHDHIALTIPFPGIGDRMARLDAACRLLPALWSQSWANRGGFASTGRWRCHRACRCHRGSILRGSESEYSQPG